MTFDFLMSTAKPFMAFPNRFSKKKVTTFLRKKLIFSGRLITNKQGIDLELIRAVSGSDSNIKRDYILSGRRPLDLTSKLRSLYFWNKEHGMTQISYTEPSFLRVNISSIFLKIEKIPKSIFLFIIPALSIIDLLYYILSITQDILLYNNIDPPKIFRWK